MENKNKLIHVYSIAIATGAFIRGYLFVIINSYSTEISLKNDWSDPIKSSNLGTLTSVLPLGAIIGCIMTSYILNFIKKRNLIILMGFISIMTFLSQLYFDKFH